MTVKSENKIDKFIIDFVNKRINILFIIAISILAILIRYKFFFGIAIVAYKIVKKILGSKFNSNIIATLTYAAVLFIPTVVLNSSAWAQCDSIYTFFVLLSIYILFKDRYYMSFIALGIALDFKLQAILILPLYIILYFKKRNFSFINFILIPLTMTIIYIPAWILGRPFNKLWGIYLHQVEEYGSLTMNFPNIYSLFNMDIVFKGPGIIFTVFIIGLITILVIQNDKQILEGDIIELSLLIVVIMTYFLPAMHDRYMYMAEVLSVIYVMIKRKNFIVPIIIIGVSFNSYLSFLLQTKASISLNIAAIVQLYAIVLIIKGFVSDNLKVHS